MTTEYGKTEYGTRKPIRELLDKKSRSYGNGVLNVLGKGQKTKHPAQPIAKLNVPDARRVLPKGLPCLYFTIRQGILHEKLFQSLSKNYFEERKR